MASGPDPPGAPAPQPDPGPRLPRVVRRPLLAAAFLTCLGALFPPLPPAWAVGLVVAMIGITSGLARRRRVLAAMMLPLLFATVGMAATALRLPPKESLTATVGPALNRPLFLEGVLSEGPEERPDHTRLYLDLVATATTPGGFFRGVEGRVRLDLPGRSETEFRAGDRVRAWVRVRPLDDASFPGGSSRRARAARRGVTLIAYASRVEQVVRLEESTALRLGIERYRSAVQRAVQRALPGEPGALVRALAIGDRSGVPRALNQAFQESGLSHLLAVSGLHLAIVTGLFALLLGALLRRSEAISLGPSAQRLAALLAMPFVVLYTLLVGASPSAVRAAVMVLALLLAQWSSRMREAWSALALAVILMVAYDPTTLGDVSFQLSFAAVAALLRLQPALMTLLPKVLRRGPAWRRWPVEILVATAAATIGTLPLVGRHFGRVAVVGLLANLPAGPLTALVLVPLSLVGGLLGTLSDRLAFPFLWLAGHAAQVLAWLARSFASAPGASLHLPQPTILECVLFYGVTIGLSAALVELPEGPAALAGPPLPVRRQARRRALAFSATCALLIVLSYWGSQAARRRSHEITVTQLPVGQGDAAVLELPGGKTVLVDAGPPGDAAERVILAFLRYRRIPKLDLVVLTHPHADHVGGLGPLAAALPIDQVWWTGDRREVPPELLAPLEQLPTQVVTASTAPFRSGGAVISVLSPRRAPEGYATVNDASVVLSVQLGPSRLLMMGDAEADAEGELLESGVDLRADALKAGHHGSRTSSTEAFVSRVSPKWAVLSLGFLNHFGFPSPAVLRRFQAHGTKIGRTDRGAVILHLREDGLVATGAGVDSPGQ